MTAILGLFIIIYLQSIVLFVSAPGKIAGLVVKNRTIAVRVQKTKTETSSPESISIPSIHTNVKLKTAPIQNGQWEISGGKTGYFGQGTSLPATPGTTVVFAHDTNGLFAYLPLTKKGDTVIVKDAHSYYVYKISEKRFINPDDVSFIKSNGPNILAVFTCFGANDAKRILLLADFIKKTEKVSDDDNSLLSQRVDTAR